MANWERAFRSEEMAYVQIMMQRDAAHATVHECAELGCVQFIDSDSNHSKTAFQRPWVSDLRKCGEIMRLLRVFRERAKKLKLRSDMMADLPATEKPTLHDLQIEFQEIERELKELTARQRIMDRTLFERLEHKAVLETIDPRSAAPAALSGAPEPDQPVGTPLIEEGGISDSSRALKSIAGVIPTEKKEALERVIFRISRGNALVRFSNKPSLMKDPSSASGNKVEEVEKDSFIIFFSGRVLGDKIKKICLSMEVHLYTVPDTMEDQRRLLGELTRHAEDHQKITAKAEERQKSLLDRLSPKLEAYERYVLREQTIYNTMNLFNSDISNKTLLAEAWVPKESLPKFREALMRGCKKSGSDTPSVLHVLNTNETPPTLIKTNKLTKAFQGLNDSYGTPRYLELNPGIFYPVTYSFLFGIMFGDIGHGTIMFVGALGLISQEKKWEGKKLNELLAPAFDGRYVLLLMSMFSIYCGFVYNECFGVSLLPWSYWVLSCGDDGACSAEPNANPPFGVDPIWGIAENKLGYVNSFKMKISILFGVSQMVFGLACKTSNCLYFKKWKDLLFENIPEYIFLLSLFGYLCVLIVIKWTTDWVGLALRPPPLLDTLLNMLLDFGAPIPNEMLLYPGQATVQVFLVVVAFLAVPVMLLVKPLLLRAEHREGYKQIEMEDNSGEELVEEQGDFDFADVMIHQSIHTIEYVLGAVSNTASYLRLWALSLAHAGLSEVFWERVVLNALELEGSAALSAFAVFCAIAVWAGLTFGVLMVMETLSACLHDIRLHWVEFQNKFYGGDGYAFTPLSYQAAYDAYEKPDAE